MHKLRRRFGPEQRYHSMIKVQCRQLQPIDKFLQAIKKREHAEVLPMCITVFQNFQTGSIQLGVTST